MNVTIPTVCVGDVPTYATTGAAAVDLRAYIYPVDQISVTLLPGEIKAIPTAIHVQIPPGFAGLVLPRSGQAKRGLGVANAPGLIDEDFRGEIHVLLINNSNDPIEISHGDRIAQLMIVPYAKATFEAVVSLDDTERGSGGFGSTGVA